MTDVIIGQEAYFKLPEACDEDGDTVSLKVKIDASQSQFISYEEDTQTITAKPNKEQHLGLSRVKIILNDGKAERKYFIVFSVANKEQSKPE